MTWHPGVSRVLPDSRWGEGVDVWCDDCPTAQVWITRKDSQEHQAEIQARLLEAGWTVDPVDYRDRCPDCSSKVATP